MHASPVNPFLTLLVIALASASPPAASPLATELAGTWAGTLEHAGETQAVALHITAAADSALDVSFSMPVTFLDRVALGRVKPAALGDTVRLGPFRLAYDRSARTLRGVVPAGLIPVHAVPMTLRRVDRFEMPKRPPLSGRVARPAWTFDAGAALWAGPAYADGVVYAGDQNGVLHAIDASRGAEKWNFRLGGPIRTRPAVLADELYLQADDGYLYALQASTGALRWRVRIGERPIVRLPFDDPKSRYDRFGSDVTLAEGRLFVGTHDGKVLCVDAEDGRIVWEFQAGDAVLAAPAVRDGRIVFGSYDRHVYALESQTGRLLWKRDTRGAVVSTPAIDGDRVVIGGRSYDLFGLDAASGEVVWNRYIWMSWVESSATIRDGTAYVGSSDAVSVYAFDARTGERVWSRDVFGWAWGQPAVSARRVYAGTSGQVGYPVPHRGGVVALDRATGKVAWRFAATAPDSGAWGFPGSPALGAGRVFVGGLDGRLLAFPE